MGPYAKHTAAEYHGYKADRGPGHFNFGKHLAQVAQEVLAAHVDAALGTHVVPVGGLWAMRSAEWAQLSAAQVCCTRAQYAAYTRELPPRLTSYGWLSEDADLARPQLKWAGAVDVANATSPMAPGLERLMDSFFRLWLFQCVTGRGDRDSNMFARARRHGNESWVEFTALDNDMSGKRVDRRGPGATCLSEPNMEPRLDLCTHLPLKLRHSALAVDLAESMRRSIGDEARLVTGNATLPFALDRELARLVHATVVCFAHLQSILRACPA
jgi:hypothetical protein